MHSFFLASALEGVLIKVLVQLIVIITAARVFAALARRIGQPRVVGEIAAGLVLGPSLLGWIAPGFSQVIFRTYEGPVPQWITQYTALDAELFFRHDVAPIFMILAQLGLIFLLFLIGLEFDFSHLRTHRAASGLISLAGIVLPFGLGYALARWMHPTFAGQVPNPLGFCLFMGTAMSITAIPILGRIMMEFNLTRTRLGAITITAAAVDDAVGWTLLAAVTAIAKTGFNGWLTSRMMAMTVGYTVFLMWIARPWLLRWTRRITPTPDSDIGLNALAAIIILLFVSAIITSLIGIFAIFGAFLLGAALSADTNFHRAFSRKVANFINAFFLPIFFTYTGLRTDIGSLTSGHLWLMAALVSATAVVGKFAGCGLAAGFSGFNRRQSIGIGAMMNTRALMELIVINVGYDLGVIPKEVFCMLVMMALLTTVMASPVIFWMMKGDPELRPLLAASIFGSALNRREDDASVT